MCLLVLNGQNTGSASWMQIWGNEITKFIGITNLVFRECYIDRKISRLMRIFKIQEWKTYVQLGIQIRSSKKLENLLNDHFPWFENIF